MPDYDKMAADYEANPPTASEVESIDVDPAVLKMGRPPKGARKGRTPVTSIRLDDHLRTRIKTRAARDHVGESEIIRRALDAYLS